MEAIARLLLSSQANSISRIGIAVVAYLMLVILAGLMWQTPMTLFFCYCAISFYLLYRFPSRSTRIYFLIGVVLGPLGETITVSLGAWTYANSSLFPIWLPLAWGIAAICLKQLGEGVEEIRNRRSGR